MQVLGTLNPTSTPPTFNPEHLVLNTSPGSFIPSVHCPQFGNITAQIILFDRPSPYRMQYMSLTPIPLVLGDKLFTKPRASPDQHETGFSDAEERATQAHLVEKLKLHTVIHRSPSQKERLLPTILAQINCCSELASLISKNMYALRIRQHRSLSVGEKVVESATTLRDFIAASIWQVLTVWVWPVAKNVFVLALISHRLVAEMVLRVLEWRPNPDSAALKDLSATAQQVDIRLQQFCYWPIQYTTLRKRKEGWESITDRHSDYIRFYNSLWLVANDVIIGIALGSYIIDNAARVAWQINAVLHGWTIEGLTDMIKWLMDWPAGLKLNNELAVFLGGLVLFMIEYWKGIYQDKSFSFTR